HESYIDASSDIDADFCLTAKGDSMIGARIHDGDVVFIKQMPIVDNGQIAAVIIDDEATLKRWYYYPDKQKLMLIAENSAYEPLVYMGEELNSITCLGRAICFMSNL
ncbi:MAG: LexA family protein, partial [Eubacteriales bacterium]